MYKERESVIGESVGQEFLGGSESSPRVFLHLL